MATKKKPQKSEDHYVVLAVERRGLDKTVLTFGPFTKARAHVFAMHHREMEHAECSVERMIPPCSHNDWMFRDVN
jgi:hypothetical protein